MTNTAASQQEFSDYLAFATYRALPERLDDRAQRERSYQHMLCRALNLGTVVGFVGAGCSWTQGYPTWKQLALNIAQFTRTKFPERASEVPCVREVLTWYGDCDKSCPSEQLTLWIGKCMTILETKPELYEQFLIDQFDLQVERQASASNPYPDLFKLDIHRFVTTNYDLELERQLLKDPDRHLESKDDKLKALSPTAGRRGPLRSFSQYSKKVSDFEQLALFALAKVRGQEDAVFHCHGRYDEPEHLIATEAQYQRWYLSDQDSSRRTFRQTIELLLESNPLLFVGYGLADDDLLRPLRYIKALERGHQLRRPLFALVPRFVPDPAQKDNARRADLQSMADDAGNEVLFERYGLHVITFEVQRRDDPEAYGRALSEKLQEIKRCWEADRKELTEKPKVRASRIGNKRARTYRDNPCETEVPRGRILRRVGAAAAATPTTLESAIEESRLLCLSGPPGSGKSKHLLALLGTLESSQAFERCFYWNAHYDNEFLPAFDDAIAFFLAGLPDSKQSRHENLISVLESEKLLLVIDGCERLLHVNGVTGEVESYSMAFTRLLNGLDPDRLRSTVVISGRVMPAQLESPRSRRNIEVGRLVTDDLLAWDKGSFKDLSAERHLPTALCSLLNGHSYGICLANHLLEKKEPGKRLAALADLLQDLARRSPNQRLHEMVKYSLKATGKEEDLFRALLERMAQFVGPISLRTCEISYRCAVSEVTGQKDARIPAGGIQEVLNDLHDKWDLIFMTPRKDADGEPCWCVHSTARRMLLQPRHGLAPDALPDFGISGLTSGRVDAYLDDNWREQVRDLFDKVMQASEKLVKGAATGGAPAAQQDARRAADLCRDAFSLLRNTMAATTVPRWKEGNYDSYIQQLIRMLRLVKAVWARACSSHPTWWSYCEYFDRQLIEDREAPLHVSELAWLYNEHGLALSAEGQLSDAYAVWEQAYELTRVMEHSQAGGGYRVEILLNLTHVFIEMGMLREARRYLDRAERFNARLRDPDIRGRILGFRGLLAYLGGNLPEASDLFSECARRLADGNNLRARSVFHKHHADLALSMGEIPRAEQLIRQSRALAEAGVFPDLVAFARVSQGHLHVDRGEFKEARREYESLLDEARRMGSRKLEAECQATLSVLCLQEGDVEGARVRAMAALSLANELALGLRLTHSMVVLGQATVRAGQRDLGVAYLRNAHRLATEQEYWHCAWKAQNALQEMGVPV